MYVIVDGSPVQTVRNIPPARVRSSRLRLIEDAGCPRLRSASCPFQPVLDGVELPRPPIDAIRAGLSADVDLLVGTTLDEWALFQLSYPGPKDEEGLARRVRRRFPGGDDLLATYRASRPDLSPAALWSALMTDVVFRVPAIRLAEAQADHRPDHTFMYRFRWGTPVYGGALGSCHALEIPFVFNNLDRGGVELLVGADAPAELARSMHDAWWHFARTGDPNHAGLPAWAAYDRTARTTMELDVTSVAVDDPDGAERRAWDELIA
jgi:para-nitrobenzyl esterase